METPSMNTRISLDGNLGTIRFIGLVVNSDGVWLGIDWDDPKRGKHDGVKHDVRYFKPRVYGAGSFIRPSTNICYGKSFLEALTSKYVETPHGSDSQEKVLLGSSSGAIQVEVVKLDKIRTNLAKLDRLKVVSLDGANVARCDPLGMISSTCPNIKALDLSESLLPGWDEIASIAKELPFLQTLALNRNRLGPPLNPSSMGAFPRLTEIRLNHTLVSWNELEDVIIYMTSLQVVEMGYNMLKHLYCGPGNTFKHESIQTINIDGNQCFDWNEICASLHRYPCLQRIIVTSNQFNSIPLPGKSDSPLTGLKHIGLANNCLESWSDIDALLCWCPAIEALTLTGNALVEDNMDGRHSRSIAIARIPSLKVLDGAKVSPRERVDSELFYISYLVKNGPLSGGQRPHEDPHWDFLCKKHGITNEPTEPEHKKLGSRLIELTTYRCFEPPPKEASRVKALLDTSETVFIKVLPSMTLYGLRMKLSKLAKQNRRVPIACWLCIDNSIEELGPEDDNKNLALLGLGNDSRILYLVEE